MNPTNEIRFVLKTKGDVPNRKVLQQKFQHRRNSEKIEWRDVPLVDEETGKEIK